MKIALISPGLLQIPPISWGSTELIIYYMKNALENLGHKVDLRFPREIKHGEYDIVHAFIANQAVDLKNAAIPYIYTLVDHHVKILGPQSHCYQQNLEAIHGSQLSIALAEWLLPYFDNHPKLLFYPLGTDCKFFDYDPKPLCGSPKLLCVANNGTLANKFHDRKGFLPAIEAAKRLNCPIIIVGPRQNEEFFKYHNVNYDKLTKFYDAPREKLRSFYHYHDIFVHLSDLEGGHPNQTLVESLACGTPVVGTYEGSIKLRGMEVVDINVDQTVAAISKITNDYDQYVHDTQKNNFDWSHLIIGIEKIYQDIINNSNSSLFVLNSPAVYRQKIQYIYTQNLVKTNKTINNVKPLKFNYHFIKGAFLEIVGGEPDKQYKVQFIDETKREIIYETTIKSGCWARPNKEYFVDWLIRVWDGVNIVFEHKYNALNQRVLVSLETSSLGDSIAMVPAITEFQRKHGCKLTISTFWNALFEKEYPEIQFVAPGTSVNCYAMYSLGVFIKDNVDLDFNKCPVDYRTVPLQKLAFDILGVEFKEQAPRIYIPNKQRTIKDKYVCISTTSTAQCKFFNRDRGWEDLIDYLNGRGFKVVVVQKEHTELKNVIDKTNGPMEETLGLLLHCEFFIGISSGVSWLAWALGKRVVMISGFTEPWNEFACERVSPPKGVCQGCWNDVECGVFRRDLWNWCPRHENTPRQFECTKGIAVEDVIKRMFPFDV